MLGFPFVTNSTIQELRETRYGVDCSVIALWLGHETMETTLTYLHAHLELKKTALAKLKLWFGAEVEPLS